MRPMHAPPRQPIRTSRWIVAAILVVSTLLVGCSNNGDDGNDEDGRRDLTGLILLWDMDHWGRSASCAGSGGYGDLKAGAQVTIRNEAGEIVGTTQLENFNSAEDVADAAWAASPDGEMTPDLRNKVKRIEESWGNEFFTDCPFQFTIEVPDATFYSISVGSRDPVVENRDKLEANDWRVIYTIGT